MKILGVTGGIGSGKSTMCQVFETMGIPVFVADDEAKKLYHTDEELKASVQQEFGDHMYKEGILDRRALAEVIFSDPKALETLNGLVHPRVGKAFTNWAEAQDAPYVIREAAILLESGSHKDCDAILLVSAPEELRIERVMARDGVSEEEVRGRMAKQWTDEKRRPFVQFELINDGEQVLIPQIEEIDRKMRSLD